LKACIALVSGCWIARWAHHAGRIDFFTYVSLVSLISPLLIIRRDLEEALELSHLSVVSSILLVILLAILSAFITVPYTLGLVSTFAPLIVLGIVHFALLLVGVTFLAIIREFLIGRLLEPLCSIKKAYIQYGKKRNSDCAESLNARSPHRTESGVAHEHPEEGTIGDLFVPHMRISPH